MEAFFFVLLVSGLFMICLEIFLPGGIIGIFGGLALAGAIVIGYLAFGSGKGTIIAISIIMLLGITVVLWIKYFPKTMIGKSLTLSMNEKDFKSSNAQFRELVGKEGETLTELRPAGIITIDGSKHDVVTEGNLINQGQRVRVIKVEGNRIVVRQVNKNG